MTNQFCIIVDKQTGEPWKTPKGKWQWEKSGLAASAFNFHTGLKISSMSGFYKIYCVYYNTETGVFQSV